MATIEYFNITTFLIINKVLFSPLVLIGLLITSLSLILNLKETNDFVKFFKESSNIRYFIRLIFNTIVILLIMFISGILVMYIGTPICLVGIPYILFTVISVVYILLLIYLIKNLFSISFTIKEIVLTSLEEDI
jgi:hypothetical protein